MEAGEKPWLTAKYRDMHFSEALTDAFVAMLKEQFPTTPFEWVTCVPSLRTCNLVPDFTKNVAQKLGLPFIPCVEKIHETAPQKSMSNSAQQVKNIEDAFQITHSCQGACLLVDDVVNSRWTLTFISALLREAGCSSVYPAALAIHSTRTDS